MEGEIRDRVMLFAVSAGRGVEHSKEFSVATIYYIKTPLRHGRMLLWLKLLPQVVAVVVKDVKNHNYGPPPPPPGLLPLPLGAYLHWHGSHYIDEAARM